MSSIYCACGYKAEYSTSKPKFCASCGNAFDAAFKRAPLPTTAATASVPQISAGYPVVSDRRPQYRYEDQRPLYPEDDLDIVKQVAARLSSASVEIIDQTGQGGQKFKLTEESLKNAQGLDRPIPVGMKEYEGCEKKSESGAKRNEILAQMRAQANIAQPALRKRQSRRPSRANQTSE